MLQSIWQKELLVPREHEAESALESVWVLQTKGKSLELWQKLNDDSFVM